MRSVQNRWPIALFISILVPAVLMTAVFLFIAMTHFPDSVLGEDTLVWVTLTLTAAGLIYALFRPQWGGIFLCIWALPLGFVFNAFHLSAVLYPSRRVGYAHFWSVVTGLIFLLGALSIVRARLSRRA